MKKFILYAPNVHTGGGFILLKSLLSSISSDVTIYAFLDLRAFNALELKENIIVSWVKPTILSRLMGEYKVYKMVRNEDRVLCFHGLPLLFSRKGEMIVFQQNRNYLSDNSILDFSFKTAVRLSAERMLSRVLKKSVTKYIVQTPSMKQSLLDWYDAKKVKPLIEIFPFFEDISVDFNYENNKKWDFVYVSDGVAHKNHLKLLEAWVLLAKQGNFPSLALTLPKRDSLLIGKINILKDEYNLNITNLGELPRQDVINLYLESGALIFPSTGESFGLPLIEASKLGITILASELDYVYDVCNPDFTFDPLSSNSIVRAVKKYKAVPQKTLQFFTAQNFIDKYIT